MNTLSTKPRTEIPSLQLTQENKKEQRTLKTMNLLPSNFDTLFGLTSKEEKIDLLKSILQNDASRCLKLINGFFIGGVDLKRLNLDLLNILKAPNPSGKSSLATYITSVFFGILV